MRGILGYLAPLFALKRYVRELFLRSRNIEILLFGRYTSLDLNVAKIAPPSPSLKPWKRSSRTFCSVILASPWLFGHTLSLRVDTSSHGNLITSSKATNPSSSYSDHC